MGLSRRYVLALVVAIIGAAAFIAIPKVTSAIHDRDAHDALVAANAGFAHLRVPVDFVPLKSDPDCMWYPCYRVLRSTRSVVSDLPAILRSTGARTSLPLRKWCPEFGPPDAPVSCSMLGLSHGYEVDVFLNGYLVCSANGQCHAPRGQSIVEINPPYIPEDAEPWNGGSGWPVH